MTEQSSAPSAANTESKDPSFRIQRIYLKDLSLEQPNSPEIFLVIAEPQVQIEVDVAVKRISDELFEVALSSTMTARVEGKVLFLVEANQAGIFEFNNIPAEQVDPMLGITCPTILYPYLRSNMADVISRAGFQPIHLNEINFHGMYEHRLLQAHNTAGNNADDAADESKIILPN
ncbi:protein-export chaperone SecB [Polynucleobacter sp. QLW-P1DATA-2]|jgi:preprotein translocase subunit SecB|uniref:protein-export chaperone SecB n=1 Tax=unclassified Polynucleobacter TaxID=2640945 RepID=UPI0008F89C81|nr:MULTISPECIES: protein-export chaperone SecB [unclassified Polynucleobacter]OIM97646.1 protein-export chaperone SecB [Polynucleobacter sp. MWH-Tro8-2-5-gr]OIN03458.1 protein-export chaperone SecB [Polynucleobacter sp. QLW-P1DATA-2]